VASINMGSLASSTWATWAASSRILLQHLRDQDFLTYF
jgi:hypothetical protein